MTKFFITFFLIKLKLYSLHSQSDTFFLYFNGLYLDSYYVTD